MVKQFNEVLLIKPAKHINERPVAMTAAATETQRYWINQSTVYTQLNSSD